MKKTNKLISIILAAVMLLSAICVSAFAADDAIARIYIADGAYTARATGNNWSLTKSGTDFTLTLSNLSDNILYKNGYIGAYNCNLTIVLNGENELICSRAETAAPYDIYAIYAENSTVTIKGSGSLKISTVEAENSTAVYGVNSSISVESGKLAFECENNVIELKGLAALTKLSISNNAVVTAKFGGEFAVATVTEAESEEAAKECFALPQNMKTETSAVGEAFILTAKCTDDGSEKEIYLCIHVDENDDGYCDKCGKLLDSGKIPAEKNDEDTCPMYEVMLKHQNEFIIGFIVIFIHRLVHFIWTNY